MGYTGVLRKCFSLIQVIFVACWIVVNGRRARHIPCKTTIDVQGDVGVKIEPFNISHVLLDSLSSEFTDGHHLNFEFKTTSANGRLFYVTRRNDDYDMVSVVITGGKIQFKIRCKSHYADITLSTFRVNDGEWHTITLKRNKRLTIKIDHQQYFWPLYVTCGGFTSVNFGSVSPEHDSLVNVKELKAMDGQFVGCIRNVFTTTGIEAPPHYVAVSECN